MGGPAACFLRLDHAAFCMCACKSTVVNCASWSEYWRALLLDTHSCGGSACFGGPPSLPYIYL